MNYPSPYYYSIVIIVQYIIFHLTIFNVHLFSQYLNIIKCFLSPKVGQDSLQMYKHSLDSKQALDMQSRCKKKYCLIYSSVVTVFKINKIVKRKTNMYFQHQNNNCI